VNPVFLLGCYGCIFHRTENSAQLCQNFRISGGAGGGGGQPPRYDTGQDRRRTIHDISEEVGIGYGTCQRVLAKELGIHRVCIDVLHSTSETAQIFFLLVFLQLTAMYPVDSCFETVCREGDRRSEKVTVGGVNIHDPRVSGRSKNELHWLRVLGASPSCQLLLPVGG
jgi:hypothetical protein